MARLRVEQRTRRGGWKLVRGWCIQDTGLDQTLYVIEGLPVPPQVHVQKWVDRTQEFKTVKKFDVRDAALDFIADSMEIRAEDIRICPSNRLLSDAGADQ